MMCESKPTVVWFQAITCNGNTHSLLSANSNRFELFLNNFDFIYHPSLTINKTLEDILENEEKIDFLLIEGSISSNQYIFSLTNNSTKNLKAGEFDEIVKGFGGVNNASTSFDYTHYFIKSSSKNMDKSLELFADLMENLTLKDEEFQPERDVVAEERRWRTDNNPMGYLQFRLFNNAYIYHPYHWTPIGFMNDIKNWTIEDIKDFHSTYYQPKNAIVIVSGDIEKAMALTNEAERAGSQTAKKTFVDAIKSSQH